MRYLVLILLLAPICVHAQTCIIAKVELGTIFIGADSRISRIGLITNKIEYQDSICKICHQDKFYFAIAGIGVTHLARQKLTEILSKETDINKIVSYLKDEVALRICDTFFFIRDNKISTYRDYINKPILQIILAYYNQNTPRLFYIGFRANEGSNYSNFGVTMDTAHRSTMAIGNIDYINNQKYLLNKNIWDHGAASGISRMIRVEADSTKEVGLPISLLRVRKTNPYWISNASKCKL